VAIHVRRGDKIRKKEADLTEAKDYVQACVRAGQAAVSDVYVMSDDPLGAAEIESNWTAFGGQPGTRFHRRFDPLRPDKTTVAVHQRNSFLHLLTDFRIMLESDFFIGTHTSNIGITVCTTRAWIQCYDAENPKGKYFWDGVRLLPWARCRTNLCFASPPTRFAAGGGEGDSVQSSSRGKPHHNQTLALARTAWRPTSGRRPRCTRPRPFPARSPSSTR
jgi:hypothetical protein